MNMFEMFGFFMLGSLFNAVLILFLVTGIFKSFGKQIKGIIEMINKLIEGVKDGQ